MQVDLTKISGTKKNVWVMNPTDGTLKYLGEYDNKTVELDLGGGYLRDSDRVLIAIDSEKNYLDRQATKLEEKW